MSEEKMQCQITDKNGYKTEIVREYTKFLSHYPDIFSDLIKGSNFDFAIYSTMENYDGHSPVDMFNVIRSEKGMKLNRGKQMILI